MRPKLHAFDQFSKSLLPHETYYLLHSQQFADEDRLKILNTLHEHGKHIESTVAWDESIDKRKYSHLKNWIEERLKAIDVDEKLVWMKDMERKIMTDRIAPDDEKKLLSTIRRYKKPGFFFCKFYELVRTYRQFLLIRLRYKDHQTADQFVSYFATAYQLSREVDEKMHTATKDIVSQYAQHDVESVQWEQWLEDVFYNEQIDGLNRYTALLRLTFIGLNYRKFDRLLEKFDHADLIFQEGDFYSKRILSNYYANRLLIHSKFKEFDKAIYYGYLSLRWKNHDYVYYVNNLAAVLLRKQKNSEALQLMKSAYPAMKETQNMYNKIGFVSFYLLCLNANQQLKSAENYAGTFLKAYKKEIIENRWHLFFISYLETLLLQNKYTKVIQLIHQNQLLELEKKNQDQPGFIPTIQWCYLVASFREGYLKEKSMLAQMDLWLDSIVLEEGRINRILHLVAQLRPHVPKLNYRMHEKLKEKSMTTGNGKIF